MVSAFFLVDGKELGGIFNPWSWSDSNDEDEENSFCVSSILGLASLCNADGSAGRGRPQNPHPAGSRARNQLLLLRPQTPNNDRIPTQSTHKICTLRDCIFRILVDFLHLLLTKSSLEDWPSFTKGKIIQKYLFRPEYFSILGFSLICLLQSNPSEKRWNLTLITDLTLPVFSLRFGIAFLFCQD